VPELPEIEALRESLAQELQGLCVTSATVRQFALVKTFDPPLDAVIGASFLGARRHGKHLLLDLTDQLTLAIHLGIGGRLLRVPAGRRGSRSTSLELGLDDGTTLWVVELGTKKRSSLHVLRSADVAAHLAGLGVDALAGEFTVERLGALLAAESHQLKRFLTDQRRIAGIGNAYSDEILWEAELAPFRLTQTLEPEDVESLHAAIGSVLRGGAERARGDNYLTLARGDERGTFRVHRREGQPCPRCGGVIASVHYEDSSLQYCPACQVDGRRYADRRRSRFLK
jgi:formamidopyrimidine-DNA glycosylase